MINYQCANFETEPLFIFLPLTLLEAQGRFTDSASVKRAYSLRIGLTSQIELSTPTPEYDLAKEIAIDLLSTE
jgi:hypothetical protein